MTVPVEGRPRRGQSPDYPLVGGCERRSYEPGKLTRMVVQHNNVQNPD